MPRKARSGVLPWLRLMRLPNVFTAIADVSMGYLFVRHTVDDVPLLVCLIAGSACLYISGMVFNDLFDREIDAKERPFRPIPSGRVSVFAAGVLGAVLLVAGVVLGAVSGWLPGATAEIPWRGGLIAVALAGCILGYDGVIKHTPLGPVAMGACRFFNVLLGMSAGVPAASGLFLGYGIGEVLVATGIGVYIIGVTWFSRSEAGVSRSAALLGALVVMLGGVAILGASLLHVPVRGSPSIYWMLLGLLMFGVLRRGSVAALDPVPEKVQAAVKLSILSLIWLDATMAVAVSGPEYGVAIAALLIPAVLLGRWVYST